jgi:hypothetical protein
MAIYSIGDLGRRDIFKMSAVLAGAAIISQAKLATAEGPLQARRVRSSCPSIPRRAEPGRRSDEGARAAPDCRPRRVGERGPARRRPRSASFRFPIPAAADVRKESN